MGTGERTNEGQVQAIRRETQGQEVESPRLVYKIKQEMCKNNRKQMNKMARAGGQGTDHDSNGGSTSMIVPVWISSTTTPETENLVPYWIHRVATLLYNKRYMTRRGQA